VALGVALVVAYKKSQTFRDVVQGALGVVKSAVRGLESAFDALRNAAASAFAWVRDHWKLALFAFGPIGVAVYLISENFDRIRRLANAAFQAILDGIKLVTKPIRELLDLIGKIHFPKKPGWVPFSLPGGHALSPTGTATRSGSLSASGAGAGGVTVNVYGAIDPEGTARAIRRILDSSDRRHGRSL